MKYSLYFPFKIRYQLPDNASQSAREFIASCLTKDYHQRPTADDLIRHPFLIDVQTRSTPLHTHTHSHSNQPVTPPPLISSINNSVTTNSSSVLF